MVSDKVMQAGRKDYDRACLFVGRFIYHWALLENAVNSALGKLLELGPLQEAIVTTNMQFRSKTNILKTLVDLKCGGTEWGKAAMKDIEAISTLSGDRNIVAHNVFGPDGEGGVYFLHTKATGKLSFPHTNWDDADFTNRCNRAKELRKRVEKIVAQLTKKPGGLLALIEAYTTQQPTAPSTQNPLGRLLLGNQDIPPATNGESPETRQAPPRK